jgi:DNA (cytosine-5)-methyltransferase 1
VFQQSILRVQGSIQPINKPRIGSLCTGYGGLDMAVEAYFNAETVWCSEFDKYAAQVVDARIGKPNLGDLTKIDWAQVEPIDILTAGYPCQPFSHAGQRKGTNDKRHIFPYIAEAISILRPRLVILENVKGHLSLGFDQVLGTLTKLGYDAKWQVVRAAEAGAPHHRRRLFIVAYPSHFDRTHDWQTQELGSRLTPFPDMSMQTAPPTLDQGKVNIKFVEYMMGLPEGWVTDLDIPLAQKFKILGNGVVRQQAYYALTQLCTPVDNLVTTRTQRGSYPHA